MAAASKTGTLGRTIDKPNPKSYLRKKTGTANTKTTKVVRTDYHTQKPKNPAVPRKDERPIMGLQTTKNYLVANAVENILAVPKKVSSNNVRYTEKKEYGKVPAYLGNVKAAIEEEKQMMMEYFEQVQNETEAQQMVMSEAEKQQLIGRLKAKWDSVNAKYQLETMHVKLDTMTKVKRKEGYEAQLQELEDAVQRLERAGPVVIREDYPDYY
jgi:cellobiose phosphorylase